MTTPTILQKHHRVDLKTIAIPTMRMNKVNCKVNVYCSMVTETFKNVSTIKL